MTKYPDEIKAFINSLTWKYAWTYHPRWPHNYIVKSPDNAAMFVKTVEYLRNNGYKGRYYAQTNTYFDDDEYSYWTMGEPIEETTIINRCLKEDTYEKRLANGALPLRIITWNVRGATETSDAWKYLAKLYPDIVLLQEVRSIPSFIKDFFDIKFQQTISKTGKSEKFNTALLVRGKIVNDLPLRSEYEWVNRELDEVYRDYFVSCIAQPQYQKPVKVVSVYNPPYAIPKERLEGIDVSQVKLKLNPKVWGSEIIWSALKNTMSDNESWVVGGDYNSSEKFDIEWRKEHNVKGGLQSNGNKEILDRMRGLGFTECLRGHSDKITPTYKDPRGNFDHQIDHLFVTNDLYSRIQGCEVGKQSDIFDKSLSDHLPIIADFKDIGK
jgi:exonuclease III